MDLKSLAKDREAIASSTYDQLANRIYSQLSYYARNKIDKKGRETGIEFPNYEDFKLYNGCIDEEFMAREYKENTLMHLWKSGGKGTIHVKNDDMEVINNCYIEYDISEGDVYIKYSSKGPRERKLDINQILDIKFEYK